MQRVLTLSLILYLPLFLATGMEFASGLSPDRIGSPAFIAFFLAWVLDGAAGFVSAIAVGSWVIRGRYEGRAKWLRGLQATAGFLLGLAPFLIADEMIRKLWLFVTH